jgi:hypothetical protein
VQEPCVYLPWLPSKVIGNTPVVHMHNGYKGTPTWDFTSLGCYYGKLCQVSDKRSKALKMWLRSRPDILIQRWFFWVECLRVTWRSGVRVSTSICPRREPRRRAKLPLVWHCVQSPALLMWRCKWREGTNYQIKSNQIKFVYCDTDNHSYLQYIIRTLHRLLEALSLFIRIPGTCPEYMHHRKIPEHWLIARISTRYYRMVIWGNM